MGDLRLTKILEERGGSVRRRTRGWLRWGWAAPLALAGGAAAQQPPPAFNENVVFVDAAHGGTDPGAHLGGSVEEKDVTLALAGRIKATLAAKGFSVAMSRDGDAFVSADQRAGVANHVRPLACVLVHATSAGAGASLAVSSLAPETDQKAVLPWATAQASYVSSSLALREIMAGALGAGKVKTVVLRASVPPVDSLACAAVTVEVAGGEVENTDYQQKVADAVAQALVAWKAQAAPPRAAPATSAKTPPAQPGGVAP